MEEFERLKKVILDRDNENLNLKRELEDLKRKEKDKVPLEREDILKDDYFNFNHFCNRLKSQTQSCHTEGSVIQNKNIHLALTQRDHSIDKNSDRHLNERYYLNSNENLKNFENIVSRQ